MRSDRPNIIFVLTDDQGYPPIGAHGHPFIRTPHLDRFHAESVRFDQFHSGTTCAPTRAGFLTGHYCNSTGVWHTVGGRSLLRADEWTLADALAEAGYRTGIFGKWHLGDAYPYRPQDRGFQKSVVHGGGGLGQTPDWWGNDYFDDTYLVDGVPTPFRGYCTDVFFAEALKFVESGGPAPFFCFLGTNAPHSPFNVPPEYQALYAGKTASEPYARFLGMISNIDENFGALRARLMELEENTILIFASDNGQCPLAAGFERGAFNAGMRGLKGSMYEGGHRVPFLMRWPAGKIAGGRSVHALAAYIDLMPTLLDLCGVAVPQGRSFHGTSLAPLARGEEPSAAWTERILVTDTQRVPRPIKWRFSCVMRDQWRLINGTELYRLADDPGQRNDVAAGFPNVVAELRSAYESWWQLCERQADDDIPISIGATSAAVTRLNSHDLRNDEGDGVWNQGQVRRGDACAGYWEILVEEPGLYEFALRRWPAETSHAMRAGIAGEDVAFRRDAIAPADWSLYEGGTALAVETAHVEIDGVGAFEIPVGANDVAAILSVALERGPRHLRCWLAGPGGLKQSPYYVDVRRIGG